MEVYVGNYVLPQDNEPYVRQRDIIKDAIQKYGTDHIAGVTVGNEFMLKYVVLHIACNYSNRLHSYLTARNDNDPNGVTAQAGDLSFVAALRET